MLFIRSIKRNEIFLTRNMTNTLAQICLSTVNPSVLSLLTSFIPLVFVLLREERTVHQLAQTMPCYSWLMVNLSDTISTVALAETERDRSVLSSTHAHTNAHSRTRLHWTDATHSSLLLDTSWSLKGTWTSAHRHFVSVTVMLERAWGKIW